MTLLIFSRLASAECLGIFEIGQHMFDSAGAAGTTWTSGSLSDEASGPPKPWRRWMVAEALASVNRPAA
jgi:hypothetical protein